MPKLTDIPLDQLESEIARRKRAQEDAAKPRVLASPDFQPLIAHAQAHVNDLAAGRQDDDTKQWFYETAMECVFGKDVFKWVNKQGS